MAAKKKTTKKKTSAALKVVQAGKKKAAGKPVKQNTKTNGTPVKAVKELHLMEFALQFSDPINQTTADLTWACQQGADVIGFTEAADGDTKSAITKVARANGYTPVVLPKGDVHLMVKTGGDAATAVANRGQVYVSPAQQPDYSTKYISWVQIKWWGQSIYVHVTHPPRLEANRAAHTKQTRVLATTVKGHGQGDSISFFMGDINIDEGADNKNDNPNMPNFIFRSEGLLTIWDELNYVPRPTISKSVFDIIGCYRPDTQVAGARAKVWPKQNSDHSPISAYYAVDVSVPSNAAGGSGDQNDGDPSAGDQSGVPADDDFYATGGNIDWSDYQDSTVYPLPYAIDDTGDSPDHG